VVERYSREDIPDAYVVRRADKVVWHSHSRNWALLIAANFCKTRTFQIDGRNSLRRLLPGLHLPVPLGRWATAASGRCPAPCRNQAACTDYVYTFAGPAARAQAVQAIWPNPLPASLVVRGRHLARLLFARNSSVEPLAAVPIWMRRLFEHHSAVHAWGRLGHVISVPRRLLPRLTAFAEAVRHET
jgi:hypothetical protein